MYRLYQDWCKDNDKGPVSEKMYRDIFNNHYNLGFGSPRSDTCATCDVGQDEDHKKRAEKAFETQRQDKKVAQTTCDTFFITFDLQKTMPLPKLTTNVPFYLRQIWLFNLGIHLTYAGRSQPYFQIWTEADGGRGCGEVASSLLAFFDAANISNGHLIAWSDSCSGQNKNFYILCLWQMLVKNGRFTTIDHKFPESGHSFMDSDRDFGLIEKRVRAVGNVYSVDQYQDILSQSQIKSKPHVTRMQGNLYDAKGLPAALGLKHHKKSTDGVQVPFRDQVRWIRVTTFGSYMFRESFEEDEAWKTVNLLPENCTATEPDASTTVKIADCCEKITGNVKKSKLDDIVKQLEYIPEAFRFFYTNLIEANKTDISRGLSSHEDTNIDESVADIEMSNTTNITYVKFVVKGCLLFNII